MAVQAGRESKWTNDTLHLLLEHFDIIQSSPSHIYHSTLPLFPSSSWLHKCYSAEPPAMVKVVKGLPTKWEVCSRTAFLGDYIWASSYHNGSIAIGSSSGDVIILDSTTGTQRVVLSGHTNAVYCVEFSSNGTLLVSGSEDGAVKLWDIQTGGVIRNLSGHTNLVICVSISVDCTKVVSGSYDTIRLWDIQTGECYCTIKENGYAHQTRFSPTNPQYFISIFTDGKSVGRICQWDTNGHQIKPPHDGSGAAFSPDGTKLVSCYKGAVTIQNLTSGAITSTFHMGVDDTRYCCFSPDSRLVAVAAGSVVHIWDITSSDPYLVRSFISHTNRVTSVVFSSPSTLISTSNDKSVKFWQVYTSSPELVISGPEPTPITLPLVSSISLQVRDGIAISSNTAGVIKTWDISTSLNRVPTQSSTKDTRYEDTKQVDSGLIFVWYVGDILNIWNAKKGEFILQQHIAQHNTLDIRISGDGSKIFHIHRGFIQAWDVCTGVTMGTVECKNYNNMDLLAVDGSRVWIEYSQLELINRMSIGWDFGIVDSSPIELPANLPTRLDLSSTKFWDSDLCGILDIVTGKVVFQLPAQFGRPVDVQWNGQYLVIGVKSKEELVLELHPALLQ